MVPLRFGLGEAVETARDTVRRADHPPDGATRRVDAELCRFPPTEKVLAQKFSEPDAFSGDSCSEILEVVASSCPADHSRSSIARPRKDRTAS